MAALRVRVTDLDAGATAEHLLSHSPARIGRGELNDLQLDRPYVSTWHGLIHFDAEGIRVVDLGSTNGTFIDGARLTRNVPAPIGAGQQLSIGRLRIELAQGAASEAPKPRRPVTSFARRIPRPGEADGSAAPAASLPEPAGVAAAPAQPSLAPAVSVPTGPSAPTLDVAALLARTTAAAQSLPPAPSPTRATATAPAAAAPQPSPATFIPPAPVAAIPTFSPGAATEVAPATDRGPRPVASGDDVLGPLRSFAEAYLPPEAVPTTAAGVQRFLETLAEVLETAIRGYVELRSGHEQFGAEMGIRVPRAAGAIGRTGDVTKLLGWLLEPNEGEPRSQQLASAYADLMIHQVALLNGVRAGAQALLTELSAPEISTRLERKSGPPGFGVWPLRQLAVLRAIEARHREFTEEESAVMDVLFGKEFARAYASLMGRKPATDGEPAQGNRRRTGKPPAE